MRPTRRGYAGADVASRYGKASATSAPAGVRVSLSYARAVLADPDDCEPHFRSALAGNLRDWPFERARILLAYGSWLRRRQRVGESRVHLREARDVFDRTGAQSWAQRARNELRAAGESSSLPVPNAWEQLSPQELQIALLAAEGLGNREIAQRLYLSRRTVGSHLYRIFPKLGLTSRTQLAAVVLAATSPSSNVTLSASAQVPHSDIARTISRTQARLSEASSTNCDLAGIGVIHCTFAH
jgi:DNA-binding NarL/FixJ family response regulator